MSQPSKRPLQVVILAAGLGKRMRSTTAKLLHPVAGRPLIGYPLAAAAALRPSRIVLVLGNQGAAVQAVVESEAASLGFPRSRLAFVRQRRQLGTGHALLQAEKAVQRRAGDLLILSGDVPAAGSDILRGLLRRHRSAGASATVLSTVLDDPSGYGRIVRGRENGRESLLRIVEHSDASAGERAIHEINSGIYVAEVRRVFDAVRRGRRSNRQGEYYLPDMVAELRARGLRVVAHIHRDADALRGVNDRADLAHAGRILVRRTLDRLMTSGVTVVDPDRTYVDTTVAVGRDTVLYPGVVLEGSTRVGRECIIRPGARLVNSVVGPRCEILDHCLMDQSRLGSDVRIGPMAHLRPGTHLGDHVRIGNFVETKKTRFGRGSKANHLSYLGDAELGQGVNVGAGTITCNYDGVNKFRTVLGDGVFIGSDSQLVAPVKVGKGAYVGAGSTITEDVPPGALAIARSRQQIKEGWARNRRRQVKKKRQG